MSSNGRETVSSEDAGAVGDHSSGRSAAVKSGDTDEAPAPSASSAPPSESSASSRSAPAKKKRQAPPTLLDFLTPTFPSRGETSSTSPLVAIFIGYSGGGQFIAYVEVEGNGAAIDRLRAIAEANDDEEFSVRVFSQELTAEKVTECMEAADTEALRTLLTAAMPEGPEGEV